MKAADKDIPPLEPFLTPVPGSQRDIYEVANQLGGYVDPSTPERLAKFLIREANEAALLSDEIVRLRHLLKADTEDNAQTKSRS